MTKSASLRSRHTSEQSDWWYCCKSQLRRADFRSVQEMEKWGGYGIEESHINNPPERVENYLIRRWQNPVCGVFERTSRWYCRWSTTKSCFQSANEILCKLRSHGLEEIHIKNPPTRAENHLFRKWREYCIRKLLLCSRHLMRALFRNGVGAGC